MNEAWRSWFTAPLADGDPAIAALIGQQGEQNRATVNLVASESYCPRSALEAEASLLVNKNATGYPPRVAFAGGAILDRIENLALERARTLFGAEHANIQALSSTVANVAVLRGLLARGDRILAFDRVAGGHSSHGSPRHVSGQDHVVETFGVDEAGRIDYDAASRSAQAAPPAMIIAGSSAYPWQIDFARLHRIASQCGAMLFADIAHVAGLVVAGLHPNPTPLCDVVTTSTHKTLCGPRTGGLILCKAKHAERVDAALAPGLQAAPGAHIIAARAVLFERVRRPEFAALMRAVVAGAQSLAAGLAQRGIQLFAGGTDTHMLVVDLRQSAWNERDVNDRLEQYGIIANTTRLPKRMGDRSGLGLRLGATPMATRGLPREAFAEMGGLVADILDRGPAAAVDGARARRVAEFARAHPIPFQ